MIVTIVALATMTAAFAVYVVRSIGRHIRRHQPLTSEQRAIIRRFRIELRQDDLVGVLKAEKGRWMSS